MEGNHLGACDRQEGLGGALLGCMGRPLLVLLLKIPLWIWKTESCDSDMEVGMVAAEGYAGMYKCERCMKSC